MTPLEDLLNALRRRMMNNYAFLMVETVLVKKVAFRHEILINPPRAILDIIPKELF